jgi:penicillin V acylase-like amidase (Ntn superfamily)
MKLRKIAVTAATTLAMCSITAGALACTRFIYETGTDSYIVGRSMDWGGCGAGPGSVEWTSKHGSVISSFYNIASVDGMNDAALVANAPYLVEAITATPKLQASR